MAGFAADIEQSINEFVCSTRHNSNVIQLHVVVWGFEFHSGYEHGGVR
jgi:hypothetical protein